jgi:S-adenosylmethionine hydrolase
VAPFHCLTFLTDYGLEDAFAAVCHGVDSQIAPDLRIIDITHLIPLDDIRHGAAVLAHAVPYFPPAVHVAVADPGVGTARRGRGGGRGVGHEARRPPASMS